MESPVLPHLASSTSPSEFLFLRPSSFYPSSYPLPVANPLKNRRLLSLRRVPSWTVIDFPQHSLRTATRFQHSSDDKLFSMEECSCSSTGESETMGVVAQNLPDSRLRRKRVFFLDVPPLCYRGKKPQPSALVGWMRLLFSQVTAKDPIVAVMDGERGNEYRKSLLPTYKSNRNSFVPLSSSMHRQTWKGDDADLREALPHIKTFLQECHLPIVSLEDAEADDVVASLTKQAIQKGMHVIVASPDKDFKQLLCEDVQIVAPLTELGRWSFYTHKLYIAQHSCDPSIELSLRCMLGDQSDNVPGLADLAPGFGRSTALKLMKKHGSLENLLNAAAIRTVGKPYIQNALAEHAQFLWRNLQVLTLRRDLPVTFKEDWCFARDTSNDLDALSKLEQRLKDLQLHRALQDGVKTATFSDRKVIRSFKNKNNNISATVPEK